MNYETTTVRKLRHRNRVTVRKVDPTGREAYASLSQDGCWLRAGVFRGDFG